MPSDKKTLDIHAGMSANTIREKAIEHFMHSYNLTPKQATDYFDFLVFVVEKSVKSVQNQRHDR